MLFVGTRCSLLYNDETLTENIGLITLSTLLPRSTTSPSVKVKKQIHYRNQNPLDPVRELTQKAIRCATPAPLPPIPLAVQWKAKKRVNLCSVANNKLVKRLWPEPLYEWHGHPTGTK